MSTSPTVPHPAAVVGLVLWRPTSSGREIAVVDVEGQTVLPKGHVTEHESEEQAARRLAAALAGARVRGARVVPTPPRSGRLHVAWWTLRWGGAEPSVGEPRARWIDAEDALVLLDHKDERALVRGERRTLVERARDSWNAPRTRCDERTQEEVRDLESRLGARPEGEAPLPYGAWKTRARELFGRARQGLAHEDAPAVRRALAEARRLELFGMTPPELDLAAGELSEAIERELSARERPVARALLTDRRDPAALARAAERVDRAREERLEMLEGERAQRVELASLAALVLLAVWTLGSPTWFDPAAPADAPGLLSGVLAFGLLGGIASAALRPRPTFGRGASALRAVFGACGALLLFAIVRAGFVALPIATAPGWLAVAFVAGFGERLVAGREPARR